MKRNLGWFVLPVALFAQFHIARAQEHPNVARGYNPDHSAAVGDIDSINKFNGNLSITIPIGGRYPINAGLSYGLTLTYNSNVWDFVDEDFVVKVVPSRRSNAGLGWLLSLGRVIDPNHPISTSEARVYESSDSAIHSFYPTLHDGEADPEYFEYTRDGSYLRFNRLEEPPGSWAVEFPNGLIQQFDSNGSLYKIRDRFGNHLTVTHLEGPSGDPIRTTLTDQHGRVHYIHFRRLLGDTVNVVDKVELRTFNNGLATYQFEYAEALVKRGCGFEPDVQSVTVNVALLTGVVSLQDGTRYSMPYDSNEALSGYYHQLCSSSGRLRRLRLPTLGYIKWGYGAYFFPDPDGLPDERKLTKSWGVQTRAVENEAGIQFGGSCVSDHVIFPPS